VSKTARRASRVGRRGGVVAAVVVLICLVLAVPVSAFVSRSVHTAVVPANLPHIENQSVRASCPPGTHVQFGGFASRYVGVTGIRRTADDQWTVDALVGPRDPADIYVPKVSSIAYCGSGPVPFKVAHATRFEVIGTATVACPAGTVVMGGGFATSPDSPVDILALERIAPDRWQVSVERTGTPLYPPRRMILTAVAYCGTGRPPKLVKAHVRSKPQGQTTQRTAIASCPAGTKLVFGGVIDRVAFVTTMKVRRSNANSWRANGYIDPHGGYITALAYCR
jgi:hypothetical protein